MTYQNNETIKSAIGSSIQNRAVTATDFIFNVWTRISAAWLSSEWSWDTCAIWLEIQEI